MADMNCSACEDIRQTSPEFIVNGLTDDICTSIQNDTGLNPNDDHNDCTDLHNLNDCLVGNEATEVEAYDVCDWKTFMKQFIPNLWTVLKAMICAICGIWTNIHKIWEEIAKIWEKLNCAFNGIVNLVTELNRTTQGQTFVRYFRDNSGTGGGYEWSTKKGSSHILDIYMDADLDNPGSQPADRDYVVIMQNCTDLHEVGGNIGIMCTYFSSGDPRSIAAIRRRAAQHPTIHLNGATTKNFSWTTSGAVVIRRGEHIRVEGYVYTGGGKGHYRFHQFVMTWIPINAGSEPLDPNTIIPCER